MSQTRRCLRAISRRVVLDCTRGLVLDEIRRGRAAVEAIRNRATEQERDDAGQRACCGRPSPASETSSLGLSSSSSICSSEEEGPGSGSPVSARAASIAIAIAMPVSGVNVQASRFVAAGAMQVLRNLAGAQFCTEFMDIAQELAQTAFLHAQGLANKGHQSDEALVDAVLSCIGDSGALDVALDRLFDLASGLGVASSCVAAPVQQLEPTAKPLPLEYRAAECRG